MSKIEIPPNLMPEIGKFTESEEKLFHYLTNKLADYFENNKIDRRELIAVIFKLCTGLFVHHTHFSFEEQYKEIDDFATHLKAYAAFIDLKK